jgi:hypothetical protein
LEAMSWPACTFTHSGGALRIRWWVQGVRQAGFVPVVFDDMHDPLPGWARGWLEAERVEYRYTQWDRRGNLNGTDVAWRICQILHRTALRHGVSHALKVDDDTVILDPELFTESGGAAAVGLTWAGDPRGGAYGMAYALRADVAEVVAQALHRVPLDPRAPEDLTVWAAVRAIAGAAEMVAHEFDPEIGPFSALPATADVRDAIERFGVLTVGNPPPGGWRNREQETAARLRQVVCTSAAMGVQRGA